MIKCHPVQTDQKTLEKLAAIFRESMEKHGVLPKNPWKAKRLETWLGKMGARFHPGSHNIRLYRVDAANFVNFKVDCPAVARKKDKFGRLKLPPRIRGRRESRWVCVEIPWELADKVLTLGYLP